MIKITEITLSRYIKGTRQIKPEILAKIAVELNITSDYLLGIDNKKTRKGKLF